MAENYQVKQGDSVFSIAFEKGFFADTIWEHTNNEEVKDDRKDPNVLMPGDVVHIPDKRLKEVSKPTNNVHKFQVKNTPKRFRIQIMRGDLPVRDMEYVLTIEGSETTGKTDGEGWITRSISPNAKKGELSLQEGQKFDLNLGFLDPVDEVTGLQGRLRTLGYYSGPINGELNDDTKESLKEFQAYNDLDTTGESDDETKSLLEEFAGN